MSLTDRPQAVPVREIALLKSQGICSIWLTLVQYINSVSMPPVHLTYLHAYACQLSRELYRPCIAPLRISLENPLRELDLIYCPFCGTLLESDRLLCRVTKDRSYSWLANGRRKPPAFHAATVLARGVCRWPIYRPQ